MTNLTANQIAQLSAIVTGGAMKRAASKEAAAKRFTTLVAEKGISGDTAAAILGYSDFEEASQHLAASLRLVAGTVADAAPELPLERTSPGLARLRASQDAEAIRQATTKDADEARAAVVQTLPSARKAALEFGTEPEAKVKPAKAKAPKAEGSTSRSKINPASIIATVVENPKKAGSRSHARFALYRAGATVQDFIDACVAAGFPAKEANADISWDRRKGFITIKEAEVETAKAA